MRPAALALALVCLAAAGCGGGRPRPPVRGAVDLPRAAAGALDGGRPAGHRGGGLEATTEGPSVAFHARLRPAGARLAVRGARATTTMLPGGAVVVWLRRLRRGTTTVRLVGTAPGRAPWRARVGVLRGPSGVPRTYEAQGVEPNRGSPGADDPQGGKVDLGIRDFAFFPARVRLRVSQIAVWHNLDHVEHTIVATPPGPPGPDSARLRFNDRFEFTALKPGVVRYACTIHPWVRGELIVVPRA